MRAHPQLEAVRAVANNTKVFFGDKLPNIFIDPSALPACRAAGGRCELESAVYIPRLVTHEGAAAAAHSRAAWATRRTRLRRARSSS